MHESCLIEPFLIFDFGFPIVGKRIQPLQPRSSRSYSSPSIENRQSKIQNSSDYPVRPRQHVRWNPNHFGFLISDFEFQSSDYFVGSCQNVRWNRNADLLGGFEINRKLKLHGLLDGKIGGLCAF
jgi:hypothetical protein